MAGANVILRSAAEADLVALARLWHDVWHEVQARIVPEDLVRLRTLQSFRDRLEKALPDVRVAGDPGEPLGFSIIQGAELHQLFVTRRARGSGVAAALLGDAETRLAARGVETAWLACAIGNERAARFYEKSGWRRVGTMTNPSETPQGIYPLKVWRFEKRLADRMPA